MKVISLWEPWATLMALGEKRIETRVWGTSFRGRVAIHAQKWHSRTGRRSDQPAESKQKWSKKLQ